MKKFLFLLIPLSACCLFVSTNLQARHQPPQVSVAEDLSVSRQTAADPAFDLPAPQSLPDGGKLMLWATNYYVYSVRAQTSGVPLLNMSGRSLGQLLTPKDWCLGGIEGTFNVIGLDGRPALFNYAGRGSRQQVDCGRVLHSTNPKIIATGRNRYSLSGGPFGDGVRGLFLVPYRTIAVDSSQLPIKYETVIYIPAARGQTVTLPSGRRVVHDGYFFAADTGGLIKRNHVDVFSGTQMANPFPNFIKSNERGTFEAYIIDDPYVQEILKKAHTTR
jgi:3D (Asp-Asp-Asp) domain-containing protein